MSDININYGFDRLRAALRTAGTHRDAGTRRRAQARAEQWRQVIDGLQSGALHVGSRTPTQYPAWVTLEVIQGGFATGKALAAGPLSASERSLLESLGRPAENARRHLNRYFLSDAGQAHLLAAMAEYRLKIEVPEHGALVVVAWLMSQGAASEALDLLDAIEPWFDHIRFYPEMRALPHHAGSVVRRMTVGELIQRLGARRVPRPVQVMNEALSVWGPLYDRLVALWAETVEGAMPALADGQVVGGWPCRRWPTDWYTRRAAWLADYALAAQERTLCRTHRNAKSNFHRLHAALLRCPYDSQALSGRDVGWVRRALANTHQSKGVVGSDARTALRHAQAEHATRPPRRAFNTVLISRLASWPADGGLSTLDGFDHLVQAGEHPQLSAGTPMPSPLMQKLGMAYEASLAELVERGIVSSGELLATFVPQITAALRSAGLSDPTVRALYEALYVAFRRRRSLLLLDYASQVRLTELPWMQALATQKREDLSTRNIAQIALRELAMLFMTRFPETITPNPLVTEFNGLAQQAGLTLPLCNELAADIFMGDFTAKWRAAAQAAAALLASTVYGRYYDLPARIPRNFGKWCLRRAFPDGQKARHWSVARNGCILEQSQIVTTHNLAVVYTGLNLRNTLAPMAADIAQRALTWAMQTACSLPSDRRGQLLAIKRAAYAWRQGIFWIALASQTEAVSVVDALDDTWPATPQGRRARPMLTGLRAVLNGQRFDTHGQVAGNGRRLLGWCIKDHWLMPAVAD